MTSIQKVRLLRAKGPNSRVAFIHDPKDGVEVTGTCHTCKRTVYLRVPERDTSSFRETNWAMCPECHPETRELKTYWRLTPSK